MPGYGTGPATFTASAEPGRDVSCGQERLELPPVIPEPQDAGAAARPADPIVVTVAPSRKPDGGNAYSTRGQLFDGAVDGHMIATRTTQPLLNGCRVLVAEEIDPGALPPAPDVPTPPRPPCGKESAR